MRKIILILLLLILPLSICHAGQYYDDARLPLILITSNNDRDIYITVDEFQRIVNDIRQNGNISAECFDFIFVYKNEQAREDAVQSAKNMINQENERVQQIFNKNGADYYTAADVPNQFLILHPVDNLTCIDIVMTYAKNSAGEEYTDTTQIAFMNPPYNKSYYLLPTDDLTCNSYIPNDGLLALYKNEFHKYSKITPFTQNLISLVIKKAMG
jgi:hypothetical protein